MEAVKTFFVRRWKQMAGVGAVYVALEIGCSGICSVLGFE